MENKFDVKTICRGSFAEVLENPCVVHVIETTVIAVNDVAMNEWIDTRECNDREVYDTVEEWKTYQADKKQKLDKWEFKVKTALGYDGNDKSVSVTRSRSEIFTVVSFSKPFSES